MSDRGIIGATLGALLLTGATALAERPSDAYILSDGNDSWCTSASVKEILAIRERLGGRFLWVRRAGKEYLVREPRTLAQAQALFAPLRLDNPEREALVRKQARLDAERNGLESQQEAIEEDLEALGDEPDRTDRDSVRPSLERRRREVEAKLARLKGPEAELEAEEEAIDARADAREAEAEAELWRLIDETIASGSAQLLSAPTPTR